MRDSFGVIDRPAPLPGCAALVTFVSGGPVFAGHTGYSP